MRLTETQYKQLLGKSLDHKINKYRNKKVIVDGIEFDSKKEAMRYQELKLLEKAKKITELPLQVPFILLDNYVLNGKKHQGIKYIADFVYIDIETGKYVVEDVKSSATKTQVYRLKKKLFESRYGIEIKEI